MPQGTCPFRLESSKRVGDDDDGVIYAGGMQEFGAIPVAADRPGVRYMAWTQSEVVNACTHREASKA